MRTWISVAEAFPAIGLPVEFRTVSGQVCRGHLVEKPFELLAPGWWYLAKDDTEDYYSKGAVKYSLDEVRHWRPMSPAAGPGLRP